MMIKQFFKRPTGFYLVSVLLLLLMELNAYGQTPQDVPHPSDSQPLILDNWAYIITFILIPLFFIILYLWLRARKRKQE